ncbi:MAG: EF-hand domain-containing protein, partial [Planctomycetota bacterium]|nr:EF-hand domain-containing protein [Planctomycetota bacterium]
MIVRGTGIISNARVATVALALLAIFGTGFDDAADQSPVQTPDRFARRFATLDINKDDGLQLDEYLKHIPGKEAILKRDFKLFDVDRNGKLSLNEFKTNPFVAPPDDRGALPDPLDAFVDHAVVAMDKSFDDWNDHPDRVIHAWTFVQLFIGTFGSQTTTPDVKEADENGDGNVNRQEARRFLEIQLGVRRSDGRLLRLPDGRVCNLSGFRQIDANSDDLLEKAEFESRTKLGDLIAEIITQGDADKDGRVSFTEWISLPNRGRVDPIAEFRNLDTNLDALVDNDELRTGIPAWRLNMTANVFPGFDTDGDGVLSLDEYRLTMLANPYLRWQVPPVDVDGDQELTYAEFKFDSPHFPLLRWLFFHRLDA